jgi:hypothetical protein
MDHDHNHAEEGTRQDYLKFAGVIAIIFLASLGMEWYWGNFVAERFMREIMAFFFLVFGLFKLYDIHGFVDSYIGYDLIARRSKAYAYLYPFIELFLAFGYFINWPPINYVTVVVTTIGAIGVARQLLRGGKIRCACLGTYIKLPLTTVSLIEDLSMGLMALVLIISK